MKRVSIYTKIFSIVGIFSLGFAVYIAAVHRSTKENLEESDYRDVIAMKDVVADVLPPPLYVIESYLVALEMERETDKSKLSDLRQRWKKLEADHADRQSYWSQNLAPGSLHSALLETAYRSAQRVFAIGDEQLLPAIDVGDSARANSAVAALAAAYAEHRQAIDQVVALADKQAKDNAAAAAEAIHTRKLELLALGLLIALVGGLTAAGIGRAIARRIQEMASVLVKVGTGDLTERVVVSAHDELGQMAEQLNGALDAVESAFLEVKRVATGLADAGADLASSTEQISSGAQQQAASLEETAASLEQITATVKQSAGNAQQASHVAVGSRDVAERGGSVVAEAVSAMNQITQASRQIGDIITTIDEIALQTNLLALNAAVEAARAGEQGRGFAVVAAEVGNLAQRSAAAAKEVKALIQDTLQRVENGHELVGESGRSLQEIILSVKKVTDIVGEIAAAAREQSVGVDQVNQAVSQMDQVTQSNAAQTQELTRTADGLANNAAELRELVVRFKLRGDAEQAPSREAARPGKGRGRPSAQRRPPVARHDSDDPPYAQHMNGNGHARGFGHHEHDDGGSDFEVT
jgi:methyl-accepting chemotaxis protein